MDYFEKASKLRLRLEVPNRGGNASVEDLWDMKVEELDTLYQGLKLEFKDTKAGSLLKKKSVGDKVIELRMDVVKHIVEVKLEEAEASQSKEQKAKDKQKLMAIISMKEDDELKSESIKELKDRLNKL